MATYNLITSVSVGAGGQASLDFNSIPQVYTDLCILLSNRFSNTNSGTKIVFNSSGTGYSYKNLYGTGSAVGSGNASTNYALETVPSGYTASTFSNSLIYIPNYAGSTNKSYSVSNVLENNATATTLNFLAGTWSNTAAITSISLADVAGTATFVQYSTAYLYGISKS